MDNLFILLKNIHLSEKYETKLYCGKRGIREEQTEQEAIGL